MSKEFIPNICGGSKIYIPTEGCSECDKWEARLTAVEEILAKKISISQTNRDGESISVEVIGEVVE